MEQHARSSDTGNPADPTSTPCADSVHYSHAQELVANTPYLFMLLLGAAIIAWPPTAAWALAGAIGYWLYGLLGAIWIMAFVCPFCHFYATRQCPCGYGQFAPYLAPRRNGSRFGEKFKKHIPVIVPLWFIPPAIGIWRLAHAFSIPLLILLLAFGLNSFVILPLLSRRHCCSSCPQKATCPWMGSS